MSAGGGGTGGGVGPTTWKKETRDFQDEAPNAAKAFTGIFFANTVGGGSGGGPTGEAACPGAKQTKAWAALAAKQC